MSTHEAIGHAPPLDPPVLFVVDADQEARGATESALVRRFGPDYRVVTAGTPQEGLDALRRLADHGDAVALVAADMRLPGMDGVDFLQRAHALHPRCTRVLLVAMDRYHTRVPLTALAALQRATALGRIDFSVVKGWVTPEEWLYPQVQEALTAWTIANHPTQIDPIRAGRDSGARGAAAGTVGGLHRWRRGLSWLRSGSPGQRPWVPDR